MQNHSPVCTAAYVSMHCTVRYVYILLLVTRMFIDTVDSCFTSLFQKFKIIVARPENEMKKMKIYFIIRGFSR